MPDTDVQTQAARNKQSQASKTATLNMLKAKKRATTEFTLYLTDDDGENQEVKLKYTAIGAKEYDKLVSKFPPKAEQRLEGAIFDIDKFAPALISACCLEPTMAEEDAKEIWDSPDWSRGDLMVLFRQAVDLNNRGIDVPFSESG